LSSRKQEKKKKKILGVGAGGQGGQRRPVLLRHGVESHRGRERPAGWESQGVVDGVWGGGCCRRRIIISDCVQRRVVGQPGCHVLGFEVKLKLA